MQYYEESISLDPFLALAHLQLAVIRMTKQRDYKAAYDGMTTVIDLLAENESIDYAPLGLRFKLCLCEALYNRAICSQEMGDYPASALDIRKARSLPLRKHQKKRIDTALRTGFSDCILFGLPSGRLFGVPESKLRNMEPRKHLKSATIVHAPRHDLETGFSGRRWLNRGNDGFNGMFKRGAEKTPVATRSASLSATALAAAPRTRYRNLVNHSASEDIPPVNQSASEDMTPVNQNASEDMTPNNQSAGECMTPKAKDMTPKNQSASKDMTRVNQYASECTSPELPQKTPSAPGRKSSLSSGAYSEDPLLSKPLPQLLKFKVHHGEEKLNIRVPDSPHMFQDLTETLRGKLNIARFSLYFRDEERAMIKISDSEDLCTAGPTLLLLTTSMI